MNKQQTTKFKMVEVMRKRSSVGSSSVRKGNLVTPTEPMFITLTGLPANRSPFRVIRSDAVTKTDDGKMKWKDAEVQRVDSLTKIVVGGDMSDDDMTQLMRDFGIEDDMFERIDGEGETTFQRRDDSAFEGLERRDIELRSGVTVQIAVRADTTEAEVKQVAPAEVETTTVKPETTETTEDSKTSIIARIRFDGMQLTTSEVEEAVSAMGIPSDACEIVRDGTSILVKRKDVEGAEATALEIDFATPIGKGAVLEYVAGDVSESLVPGVSIQYRSDTLALRSEVVENFGMWGWYQNTFDAAMADADYSSKASKAIDVLNDVLYDLLFWQREYTLAEVEKFVEYSFDQAKLYILNLLGNRASASQQRNDRGNTMAITKEDQVEIAKIVANQLAERDERQRKDAEAKATADAAAAEKDTLATTLKAMAERMDSMSTQIESLTTGKAAETTTTTTTVVQQRADGAETADDAEVTDDADNSQQQQRSDNVFAGCFGNLTAN